MRSKNWLPAFMVLVAVVLASTRTAFSQVSIDSVTTAQSGPTTSLTWPVTVGSTSNRLLLVVVSVHYNHAVTITGVTYGGTGLTPLGIQPSPGTNYSELGMFYMVNPTSGTANVVATIGSSNPMAGSAIVFSNAAQAAPSGFVGNSGSTAQATLSVTGTSGWSFFDAVAVNGSSGTVSVSSAPPCDSQSQLWNIKSGTASADIRSAGGTAPGAASMNFCWDLAVAQPWAIASIGLQPAAVTAVRLKSFSALREGADVLLRWRTGYEVSNLGFRIYRENPDGSRKLVTPGLVAGSALMAGSRLAQSEGDSYTFVDRNVPPGSQYWLEDVDLNGSRTDHGPATASERGARFARPASAGGAARAPDAVDSPLLSDLNAAPAAAGTPPGFGAVRPENSKKGRASATQTLQFSLAAQADMKILVRQEGWYRFTRQDLASAGWDPGASSEDLQLYAEGQPVPMLVTDLGGGDYSMEFYGTAIDTPWTDTRVYWLAPSGSPGLRIGTESSPSGSPAPSSFPFAVERKDRLIYAPGITTTGDASGWYGPIIGPPDFPPAGQSMTLSNVDPADAPNALLELSLQGATPDVTHVVDVTVNGEPAGTISFDGQSSVVRDLSIPTSWLLEGANSILLSGEGPDYSLVDDAVLTYPHQFRADQDALDLALSGNTRATISGFSSALVRVFDITDPSAVAMLPSTVETDGAGGYSVSFSTPPVAGSLKLLAFGDDRVAAPAFSVNMSSNLNSPKNHADLVIIAHPDFLSTAAPLAAVRQSEGLKTKIANLTDIYDEFGYGEESPQAIKDFLANAVSTWQGKRPGYVLLVGDGSYDPRDYLGHWGIADSDFVPVELINGALQKTASDDWYVDFNGDTLADLPIGRIPVDTPQEAATVVSKIVSYDQSSPSPEVLLAADQNDENDFEGAVSALAPLVGDGYTPRTLTVGQVGGSAAHSQILDAFNAGDSLINWVGHGEQTSWSKQDVFDGSDISGLKNSDHPAVVLAMDCLNGYFHDPATRSLAEQLLVAPNGGAAAVWASTTLTEFLSQAAVNQALFRHLFRKGKPVRLGDAMLAAKAATADTDVRQTWTLFGDPTMVLK